MGNNAMKINRVRGMEWRRGCYLEDTVREALSDDVASEQRPDGRESEPCTRVETPADEHA